MQRYISTLVLLLGIHLSDFANVQAAPMNCHLHAPAGEKTADNKAVIFPSVGDQATCEELNQDMFLGSGFCHCRFGSFGSGRIPSSTNPGFSIRNPMPLP